MTKVTLISANIVTQKGDFFGTGIPYFPLVIAYTAAYLQKKRYEINLIDAFGEDPFQVEEEGNKFIQGLTPSQVVSRIEKDTALICLGAERVVAHGSLIKIIQEIQKKEELKNIPIAILENTQAVTAYSLKQVKDYFFQEGVQYVLAGEPEQRVEQLLCALKEKHSEPEVRNALQTLKKFGMEERKQKALLDKIDGLIYKNKKGEIIENEKKEVINNPDILPFPAWDLFRLENYWKLGYAHAPLTTKKYLPLLTSRGCPYPCTFCVVPDTNSQRWRSRTAKNVVDEIEKFAKEYGVTEYHLEDLNPTIKKERMVEIAKEILKRNLNVIWKIGSGTKVETLDEETIQWMAKAGCTYISISPESGSERIMKLMKKPFPYDRALELVREMEKNNITTQACFILGYPGEEEEDIQKTMRYIRQIVKAGIDEIAVLILTPTPGSKIFEEYTEKNKLDDITKLTFTPIWRKDYKRYERERIKAYLYFLYSRLWYRPLDVLKQPIHFLTKKFQTKMEMTLYRVMKIWLLCQAVKNNIKKTKRNHA